MDWQLVAGCCLVLHFAAAALWDLVEGRVPLPLTLSLLACGLVAASLGVAPARLGPAGALASAMAVAAALALICRFAALIDARARLGRGDQFFLAATAAWVGFPATLLGCLAACAVVAAAGRGLRPRTGGNLPFAPAFTLGVCLLLALATPYQ